MEDLQSLALLQDADECPIKSRVSTATSRWSNISQLFDSHGIRTGGTSARKGLPSQKQGNGCRGGFSFSIGADPEGACSLVISAFDKKKALSVAGAPDGIRRASACTEAPGRRRSNDATEERARPIVRRMQSDGSTASSARQKRQESIESTDTASKMKGMASASEMFFCKSMMMTGGHESDEDSSSSKGFSSGDEDDDSDVGLAPVAVVPRQSAAFKYAERVLPENRSEVDQQAAATKNRSSVLSSQNAKKANEDTDVRYQAVKNARCIQQLILDAGDEQARCHERWMRRRNVKGGDRQESQRASIGQADDKNNSEAKKAAVKMRRRRKFGVQVRLKGMTEADHTAPVSIRDGGDVSESPSREAASALSRSEPEAKQQMNQKRRRSNEAPLAAVVEKSSSDSSPDDSRTCSREAVERPATPERKLPPLAQMVRQEQAHLDRRANAGQKSMPSHDDAVASLPEVRDGCTNHVDWNVSVSQSRGDRLFFKSDAETDLAPRGFGLGGPSETKCFNDQKPEKKVSGRRPTGAQFNEKLAAEQYGTIQPQKGSILQAKHRDSVKLATMIHHVGRLAPLSAMQEISEGQSSEFIEFRDEKELSQLEAALEPLDFNYDKLPEIPRLRSKFRDDRVILGDLWHKEAPTTKRRYLKIASRLGLEDKDWNWMGCIYNVDVAKLALAAEVKDHNEHIAAATKVQRKWRSMRLYRSAVRLRRERRVALVKIQRWWRRMAAFKLPIRRRVVQQPDRLRAANLLQAFARGWVTRHRLRLKKDLHGVIFKMECLRVDLGGDRMKRVVEMQAVCRGFLARRLAREKREEARIIRAMMEEQERLRAKKNRRMSFMKAPAQNVDLNATVHRTGLRLDSRLQGSLQSRRSSCGQDIDDLQVNEDPSESRRLSWATVDGRTSRRLSIEITEISLPQKGEDLLSSARRFSCTSEDEDVSAEEIAWFQDLDVALKDVQHKKNGVTLHGVQPHTLRALAATPLSRRLKRPLDVAIVRMGGLQTGYNNVAPIPKLIAPNKEMQPSILKVGSFILPTAAAPSNMEPDSQLVVRLNYERPAKRVWQGITTLRAPTRRELSTPKTKARLPPVISPPKTQPKRTRT